MISQREIANERGKMLRLIFHPELARSSGRFSSTPLIYGDWMFMISDRGIGTCVELAASNTFKILAHNSIVEGTRSTPAIAGGKLYVRTFTHLISLGGVK